MGYKDRVVIAVSGDYDSTYMLQANVDRRGFTMLSNDVAEVSTVMGDDVDNYIYVFKGETSKDGSDNIRNFSLGAEVYTEDLEYGVRLCNDANGWESCMLNKVDDTIAAQSTFEDIKGDTHENNAIKYFVFSYDITKCRQTSNNSYTCSFQVVCFNPGKSSKPTTYMIDFAELGVESNLQEGVPRKDRVEEGETKKYLLDLSNVADIYEVNLVLTTISGDCLLWATEKDRDTNITDTAAEIGMNDTIVYDKNISKRYYVRVLGYAPSYYSLTAVIHRKSGDTEHSKDYAVAPVQLIEGPSQMGFLVDSKRSQQFYIQLRKQTPFSIDVSNIKGSVDFDVRPSTGQEAESYHVWNSDWDSHLRISEINEYTADNEFIVTVRSTEDAIFEISYNREGTCPRRSIGRLATIDVAPGE